jgi:hypothetical protein
MSRLFSLTRFIPQVKRIILRPTIRSFSRSAHDDLKTLQKDYDKIELQLCQASTYLYKLKNDIPLDHTEEENLKRLFGEQEHNTIRKEMACGHTSKWNNKIRYMSEEMDMRQKGIEMLKKDLERDY